MSHEFDLADSAAFIAATPRALAKGRTTLPGLVDPNALDAAQIVKLGYPPRPDPASPLYKKWLDIVSKPLTHIDPTLAVQQDLRFNPETTSTSNNWDGMLIQNSGRLSLSVGTFFIPAFSSTGNGSQAVIWSGLDRSADVVQDGVVFRVVNNVGTYSAWHEYFPAPPVFSSMVVGPVDTVDFWAWEGDASYNYGTNLKGFGCFWYENKDRGTAVGTFVVAKPSSAPTFTGATAEGIIERVSGANLAKWPAGGAFLSLDAYDWNWAYHDISGSPDVKITLKNSSGTTLATAANFNGGNEMSFTWFASH